jgi:EAL domain-containing protein (putative c-di-GMP-specific phosphodiesterase class I)
MQETIMKRIELESRLNNALCHSEFILYFQPQVDLTSRQVVGAEALIRWQHEDGSLTLPNEFIPVAEECGLIQQIDNWVLKTACTQANQWRQQGHRDIKISVNLSSVQFNKDKDLVGRVKRILDKTGFPPRLLTLEITENAVMTDTNVAIQTMKELTDLGIAIAIDDFGTGYSSLSYVKNFPAKYLKIDRSFVKDIPHDSDDMAIAASIITLAKNLRMEVIAEGVETDSQSAFLAENHCQQVQGYLFGRPQDAATFEQQFLTQQKN